MYLHEPTATEVAEPLIGLLECYVMVTLHIQEPASTTSERSPPDPAPAVCDLVSTCKDRER